MKKIWKTRSGEIMPCESGNEEIIDPPTPIFYEENLESPSNYTKKKKWHDRSQYGNILRGLISSQITQYKRESNRIKKTRISQNIGYLIQVMASLINQEKNIEERLEQLEQLSMRGYGR